MKIKKKKTNLKIMRNYFLKKSKNRHLRKEKEGKTEKNLWIQLQGWTQARLDLDKKEGILKTKDLLSFQIDWAKAKDALCKQFDPVEYKIKISKLNFFPLDSLFILKTQVVDLSSYLQRPDLGQKLSNESMEYLKKENLKWQNKNIIVLTPGLSALALENHGIHFLRSFFQHADPKSWICMISAYGRVGLSDDIGQITKCEHLLMLVGERPGLSCNDSLGLYYTYQPQWGKTNSNRNCISNIHHHGLSYDEASRQAYELWNQGNKQKNSGVHLKIDCEEHMILNHTSSSFKIMKSENA